MPETKSASLRLRMKPSELAEIKAAAEHADVTVSAWVTERLMLAANQELVTVPPPAPARELAARPPGVQAPPIKPSISPADAELVLDALGADCLLCGEQGDVVAANRVAFEEGRTGPSNLQVLCGDCAEQAGDLRDSGQLDAITAAVDARPSDR